MAKKRHAWTAQRTAPPFNSTVMRQNKMALWKIYFWLVISIYLATYAVEISVRVFELFPSIQDAFSEPYETIELIEVVFSFVPLIAVFGYAYEKMIFNRILWQIVFAINFCLMISIYFSSYKPLLLEFGVSIPSFGMLALILFFTVPEVIGNYLYAFKSNHIWSNEIA